MRLHQPAKMGQSAQTGDVAGQQGIVAGIADQVNAKAGMPANPFQQSEAPRAGTYDQTSEHVLAFPMQTGFNFQQHQADNEEKQNRKSPDQRKDDAGVGKAAVEKSGRCDDEHAQGYPFKNEDQFIHSADVPVRTIHAQGFEHKRPDEENHQRAQHIDLECRESLGHRHHAHHRRVKAQPVGKEKRADDGSGVGRQLDEWDEKIGFNSGGLHSRFRSWISLFMALIKTAVSKRSACLRIALGFGCQREKASTAWMRSFTVWFLK
ncbi:MAG: hypothetical protein BWY83_03333 [bacterium ADurb.Bin478]|nr:MAG: hypothetical protein BWY83_03333 [bacterium ADurb.Bin478]